MSSPDHVLSTSTPHRRERAPAFQFYPRDWVADARVTMMSYEQRGMYMQLLCHCWLEGSLPSQPEQLAKLLHLRPKEFGRVWPAIAPCFEFDVDGRLVHPVLDAERRKQEAFRARQSANGKRGGRPRGSAEESPFRKGLGSGGFGQPEATEKLCSLPSSPAGETPRAAAVGRESYEPVPATRRTEHALRADHLGHRLNAAIAFRRTSGRD